MDNSQQDIATSIHNTSTTFRDIALICGIIVGVTTFFITRPEFNAKAKADDDNYVVVISTLKKILTTQCKFARVDDKLKQADVDEACKQL